MRAIKLQPVHRPQAGLVPRVSSTGLCPVHVTERDPRDYSSFMPIRHIAETCVIQTDTSPLPFPSAGPGLGLASPSACMVLYTQIRQGLHSKKLPIQPVKVRGLSCLAEVWVLD
ncbi:unnamed protein product [Eretmochelys imbricata]